MKRVAVAAIAGAALYGIPALAADLPTKVRAPKPISAPSYRWTGFYAGVNAGIGIAGARVPTDPTDIIGDGNGDADGLFKAGFTGGLQAGDNWQFAPSWVVGIEGDVGALSTRRSICDINDCLAAEAISISSQSNFLATLRGRFGYVWNNSLLYVTGGAAWVGLKDAWSASISGENLPSEVSTVKSGWTIGGGIETALTGNWTLKTEYLFVDPGDVVVLHANGDGSYLKYQHQYQVARLGLNYKFGEGLAPETPSAPAVMSFKARSGAPASYSWSGLYIGGNAGAGIAGTRVTTDPTISIGDANGDNDDLYKTGFAGGGQIGYNWQFAPRWVSGIEGDVGVLNTSETHCNINDCSTGTPLLIGSKSDFLATLRGRLGYAWDRSLLYATAGAAWVGVKDSWTDFTTTRVNERSTALPGWTVGGGLETALAGNWTAKIEYLFVDAGTNRVLDSDGDGSYLEFKHQYHVARLGLNYRFGQAPAPGY